MYHDDGLSATLSFLNVMLQNESVADDVSDAAEKDKNQELLKRESSMKDNDHQKPGNSSHSKEGNMNFDNSSESSSWQMEDDAVVSLYS